VTVMLYSIRGVYFIETFPQENIPHLMNDNVKS
jgi:hypothetical protein